MAIDNQSSTDIGSLLSSRYYIELYSENIQLHRYMWVAHNAASDNDLSVHKWICILSDKLQEIVWGSNLKS